MTSRNFIVLIFILSVGLSTSYGQSKQDKSSILAHTKEVFKQINEYKNYKIVSIDDAEEFLGHGTDNGASLKGYYKGDSIKKIIEWAGLSNRVVQNEYYFDKDKLIFVYSTDSKYKFNDSTQSFDYSKFDHVFKGRYYFSNDKLIEAILSDKGQENDKQKDAKGFLTSSKDYRKLLNAKRK
jgi:hypothetical protein